MQNVLWKAGDPVSIKVPGKGKWLNGVVSTVHMDYELRRIKAISVKVEYTDMTGQTHETQTTVTPGNIKRRYPVEKEKATNGSQENHASSAQ